MTTSTEKSTKRPSHDKQTFYTRLAIINSVEKHHPITYGYHYEALTYSGSGSELTDAQWIMIVAPNGPGDIFRQPFIDHGFTPPPALTTSESYFGALSLVESLGAVCTFPSLLLAEMSNIWKIAPIPVIEEIPPLKIALMTRAGHPLTPAADALATFIRRQIGAM